MGTNYDWLISQKQVQTWIDVLNTEAANIGQWIVTASLPNLPVFMEVVAYTVIVPILVYFMLSDKDRILEYLTSFSRGQTVFAGHWRDEQTVRELCAR